MSKKEIAAIGEELLASIADLEEMAIFQVSEIADEEGTIPVYLMV